MSNVNLFEYASRNALRFESPRGLLTVEQLWDVPLRSTTGFDLDTIAKQANARLKAATEESFVDTKRTAAHDRLSIVFEIMKHVIETKLNEEKAAETRAANRVKKAQLLNALSEKQAGKLSELSEQQLKKQIAALSDEE